MPTCTSNVQYTLGPYNVNAAASMFEVTLAGSSEMVDLVLNVAQCNTGQDSPDVVWRCGSAVRPPDC